MDQMDSNGEALPPITWQFGLIFGGDDVRNDQKRELHARGLAKWWTYDRLRLLLSDGTETRQTISARELQCFTKTFVRDRTVSYRVSYEGGESVEVDVGQDVDNMMKILRRSKLDATMRQPRCYYRMGGSIVPVTVAKLKLVQLYWQLGIMHAALAHLPAVRVFKKRMTIVAATLRELQGGKRVQHRERDGPVAGSAVYNLGK